MIHRFAMVRTIFSDLHWHGAGPVCRLQSVGGFSDLIICSDFEMLICGHSHHEFYVK